MSRLAASVLLVLSSPLVLADGPAAKPADDPGHREERNMDPGVVSRADQERTDSATVQRNGHTSVQVNVDGSGMNIANDAANEPSMAVDPTNPNNIVVGWRQFDTISSDFRQAGMAYSHDGGQTWTFPDVLDRGQFRSDPVIGADSNGTFFYYSLSTTTTCEMFISDDKGLTWSEPIGAQGGDKNWMTVDTSGGQGDGHLYPLWNSQFTCCAQGTDLTRSTNGGVSYEPPLDLPQKAKWGTASVGPDGELYVVGTRTTPFSFPQPHLIHKSLNAQDPGATPSFTVTGLDMGGETQNGQFPNPGGLMGQVWVDVDRSAGATRGNVYVLGSIDPAGADPLDVHFIRSEDGGDTWSNAVRINSDPVDNGAYQWFGAMSVAPDGRIDVTWNDTRGDPGGDISEVYYAYSTDAGVTWSEELAVTPSFNSRIGWPVQQKMGDYTQMFSDSAGAALIYAATFNGEQDVWFLRLGDCNENGVHDSEDIDGGTSNDCNGNLVPDECEQPLVCPVCDNDGLCEVGEDCNVCAADCIEGPAGCGNGTCELGLGEDCLSCPDDCAGEQSGNPGNRYCCGDGAGTNPVGCGDARCTAGALECSAGQVPAACCGDAICNGDETLADCAIDCDTVSPGEAGQLIVTGVGPADEIDFTYAPACSSPEHTIAFGPLAAVSTYGYSGQECNIGNSGSVTGFQPGPGSFFFLVVGHDEVGFEGSYGLDSAGNERPEDVLDPVCLRVQDLSQRCD